MPGNIPAAEGEAVSHEATSAVLERLMKDAPADGVTLGWVLSRLRERSFGVLLLLLGTGAILPGISAIAGLLLAIPAFQMVLGRRVPVFPRRIAARRVPMPRFIALVQRAVPVLRTLERFIRPRWPTPVEATKRVVGLAILVLGACLLIPVPLSNIPPGLVIMLIAVAYLEEDGILLSVALAAALALVAAIAAAVWGTVETTLWLGR